MCWVDAIYAIFTEELNDEVHQLNTNDMTTGVYGVTMWLVLHQDVCSIQLVFINCQGNVMLQ